MVISSTTTHLVVIVDLICEKLPMMYNRRLVSINSTHSSIAVGSYLNLPVLHITSSRFSLSVIIVLPMWAST